MSQSVGTLKHSMRLGARSSHYSFAVINSWETQCLLLNLTAVGKLCFTLRWFNFAINPRNTEPWGATPTDHGSMTFHYTPSKYTSLIQINYMSTFSIVCNVLIDFTVVFSHHRKLFLSKQYGFGCLVHTRVQLTASTLAETNVVWTHPISRSSCSHFPLH